MTPAEAEQVILRMIAAGQMKRWQPGDPPPGSAKKITSTTSGSVSGSASGSVSGSLRGTRNKATGSDKRAA